MERPSVALLIDWENIKYSATNNLGSPPDIITLKKIARRYGKIAVAKAYANWADIEHDGEMERFALQKIEPVFVQTRRFSNEGKDEIIKGSSDIRLACDCIELLFTNTELTTFVIASGDGGFSHLMDKIKARGRAVATIGVRGAISTQLGVAVDDAVMYDDWVAGLRIGSDDARISKALTEFQRAVEDIRREGSSNTLQAIKQYMKKRDPEFEEEKIGISSFRHLAYLAEMRRLVKIDGTSEPATAYRYDEDKTDDERVLHSGVKWASFLQALKKNTKYNLSDLQDIVKKNDIYTDDEHVKDFLSSATKSQVLWYKLQQYYIKKENSVHKSQQWFLNLSHPKVLVYKSGENSVKK